MFKRIGLLGLFACVVMVNNIHAVDQSMPLNATAQDYINAYNSSALEYAVKQGNHNIIADLLEKNQIKMNEDSKITIGCLCFLLKLQQLEDLEALFNGLFNGKISTSELIQVLRVFKTRPRKIDQYGGCEQILRVCHGNNALDFTQLPEELRSKIANILEIELTDHK